MTLEGTNTWVLAEPGSTDVVVVDPGPLHEPHLRTVLDHVADRGARVALTLLTHGHADHAESAPRWRELTGAPVRAVGRGHDDLGAGETVRVGGLELLVVPTPGHTSDSVSFLLPAEQVLLTGDTVLGRGTTVVAYPDGDLTSYLASLQRLDRLTRSAAVASIAPGHGPVVPDAARTVEYYLTHRHERLEQVRAAVASLRAARADPSADEQPPSRADLGEDGRAPSRADLGEAAPAHPAPRGDLADQVVERVYADVPRAVWPAARLSVLAQLDYLGEL
jgi:glyoxylase-like metal-dependent hydrolase (beta-lactamase superfamily II)